MPTRIDIDYTRRIQNAEAQEIVSRGNSTTAVLVQLGANYQSLPDAALGPYQAEVAALAGKITLLNSLVDQIRPVLQDIDDLGEPLDDKNKRTLGMLRNALRNDADINLLDQITGPTPTPTPATSPPAPGP